MDNKKCLPQWLIAGLFPAVLFYYEAVFRLSTVRGLWKPSTVWMALLCLVIGGVFYLLSSLSKRKAVNFTVTLAYFFLTMLPFFIEYFVYRKFKIFYDLNTTLGGAGGALTDFQKDIWQMVFTWEGITRILLFFLPTVLYAVLGWRFAVPKKIRIPTKAIIAAVLIAVLCLSLFGISSQEMLGLITGKEYNFQSVVSELGLLTGLGLDVRAFFSPMEEYGGFEQAPTIPPLPTVPPTLPPTEPTVPGETQPIETLPPETEPPVVYTPNALDIDYANLEAKGTIAQLNAYVATLTPSMKNQYTGLFEGKNLIFITAEAFSAEVIDPELTPTLYRLANKGIQFLDYYQPSIAGTTGGEYQNIFSMLPTQAGMSFKLTRNQSNYYTMGMQLNRLGYYGMAYHNHDYKFYERHKTHTKLGYSNGYMGFGNGMEEFVKDQWPKSDLEMFQGTVPTYIDQQPFNIYYMTVSGHSNYGMRDNCMVSKNWEYVQDLPYSNQVKGYFAANLELEHALAYLVEQLEAAGIADDTVIVIASDHFPYGLDDDGYLGNMPYLSELYGYNVKNAFQRDHNRLIIWSGCLEEMEPIVVDSPTSCLDILPTLSNLFGTEFDSRLMVGRDVLSDAPALVFNLNYQWKTDYGTYMGGEFHPADPELEIPEGYVEAMKVIVRNKIRFCEGVLETDYYGYLFKEE